jgi:hypothetical protein
MFGIVHPGRMLAQSGQEKNPTVGVLSGLMEDFTQKLQ